MTDEKRNLSDGEDPSVEGELAPRGEDLASRNLPEAEDYDVVDPQAEELTTPDKTDPKDGGIDDPEQLQEAEKAATSARSSRPVRKKDAAGKPARRGMPERQDSQDNSDEKPADKPDGRKPKRKLTKAPVRKQASKQKSAEERKHRTGPVTFTKQSVAELRKVKWPTGDELGQYFLVVLIFVLLIIAYVSGLDVLFGWIIIKLFGN
ncbi:preprotein translocase subunit SecE [Cutibacterium sp.]|uniref:preprotein translocase subunit SecE n=1 Tax=Cutibacterium sp. TaxID=1912221 RepID=UPI0026DBAD51|nr:preprotein translocase subunit SecE [Cutibacterium sp.]MDO4413422.1 preprotein translocase subunit SecE [Cutibacterium sp.]